MAIKARDLRRQAVTHSLFSPTTLAKAVARLGFVQADPIAAPARAQDLILRHRVTNYRAGDLERRYPRLAMEEDYIHVYGFFHRPAANLLHPRRASAWGIEQEYPGLAEQVLEFVQAQGAAGADHRQLEKALGKMRTGGHWGGYAKATTRALEMLHYRGLLRIANRAGNLRRYMAVSSPIPPLPDEERLRRLVVLLARLYAPVTEGTLRYFVNSLRYASPGLVNRRTAIRELVEAGDLVQAQVDGLNYYWPKGSWQEQDVPDEVRWLAPFDPVVWDRARFEHLWGWPYRFEAYTPAPKRLWGYYALPMLWRDRIIGWANTSVADDTLQVSLGYVTGSRPRGRDFKAALEVERERLGAFLGVGVEIRG